MQPVTVAIADEDFTRRVRFEQALKNNNDIIVLTNVATSSYGVTRNRRRSCRANISFIDEVLARVRRLDPRVLLLNLKCCCVEHGDILGALRRECPHTRVLLIADQAEQQQEQLMQAIAKGARGYVERDVDSVVVAKAAHVVDDGGSWMPLEMLNKLMNQSGKMAIAD